MSSRGFLPDFETRDIETAGARIHLAIGGSGPPLLLLHGHPQTHLTWHKIAPRLAECGRLAGPHSAPQVACHGGGPAQSTGSDRPGAQGAGGAAWLKVGKTAFHEALAASAT